MQYKTVIQTASLNSKFRSFLVRILIQKDNTCNKVLKKEFYTKETSKKGIEKIKCCEFQFNFLEFICESVRATKFFEFEYFSFLFLFCRNVSQFI